MPAFSATDIYVFPVDAGVFPDGTIASGCICKDPGGETISASCKKEAMVDASAVAEMLDTRWCLELAKENKLVRIVVQSDCLNAVNCINSLEVFACREWI